MNEAERLERYAAALQAMCKLRGIPATGYALARYLRTAGFPVHANTLDKHLHGERSPRGSTMQKILSGLSASDAERAMVLAPDGAPNRRRAVSWRDALVRDVDKGRETEEVLWWSRVGTEDEGDVCVEHRRTVVGATGLRSVSFGPGQMGGLIFDLLDTSRLGLEVHAEWLTEGGRRPVTAAAHVVEIEPDANKYAIIVRFGKLIPNGAVLWTVRYSWPGLWRSLRLKGSSSSDLHFTGRPAVTKTTIEMVAPAAEFHDLQLVPMFPEGGSLERQHLGAEVQVRWVVLSPPSSVRYQVLSPSHARPAGKEEA